MPPSTPSRANNAVAPSTASSGRDPSNTDCENSHDFSAFTGREAEEPEQLWPPQLPQSDGNLHIDYSGSQRTFFSNGCELQPGQNLSPAENGQEAILARHNIGQQFDNTGWLGHEFSNQETPTDDFWDVNMQALQTTHSLEYSTTMENYGFFTENHAAVTDQDLRLTTTQSAPSFLPSVFEVTPQRSRPESVTSNRKAISRPSSRASGSRRTSQTGYLCDYSGCGTLCSRMSDLERHMRHFHGLKGPVFFCGHPNCRFNSTRRDYVKKHAKKEGHAGYPIIEKDAE